MLGLITPGSIGKVLKLGICAILEFKKVVEDHHIGQAIIEMIIANCFVNKDVKVFGYS